MNRTEYSLSLDSVICRRCNTVSRVEEDTCPSCGADRQGAILTSAAEIAASAAPAAAVTPEQLDIVDLRDANWLKRVVRRRMVTSYPSLAEPGDEAQAPSRGPARSGIAVLVGGVFAGLAAGGYWYVHSGDDVDAAKRSPAISAAGPIHDGASDPGSAGDTRHASLTRAKPESTSTQAAVPASAAPAKAGRVAETAKSGASQGVAQAAAGVTSTGPQAAAATALKPAAPGVSVATRTQPDAVPAQTRIEKPAPTPPRVAAASAPPTLPATATTTTPPPATSALAAAPVAKPSTQITSANVVASPAASVSTKPVASSSATGPVVAAAPSVKDASPTKTESRENPTLAAASAIKAPTPGVSTPASTPRPAALAAATAPNPAPQPAAPSRAATSTTPATVASTDKPAAPQRAAATSTTPATVASTEKAAAPQRAIAQDKPRAATTVATATTSPAATTIASIEKPAAPAVHPAPEALPPSVARNIAAVQQALASRDLASARRHMRGLAANQPRSPEIQQLAADLSRQERARDSAIATARSCAASKEPSCALRNARRAVALDPRNGQAQSSLRQALAVQNETNTEYFRQASGIPKPVVPTMTFDGRWTVGGRHAATSGEQDDQSHTSTVSWGVPTVSRGRGDAH